MEIRGEGVFGEGGVREERKESLAGGRHRNEGHTIPHEPLKPVAHHSLCPSTLFPYHTSIMPFIHTIIDHHSDHHPHSKVSDQTEERRSKEERRRTWKERVGTERMIHTDGGYPSPSTCCIFHISLCLVCSPLPDHGQGVRQEKERGTNRSMCFSTAKKRSPVTTGGRSTAFHSPDPATVVPTSESAA